VRQKLQLITRNFGTGTRGFASLDGPNIAVCVLPRTELAFAEAVQVIGTIGFLTKRQIDRRVAIFRQINKMQQATHHDALEFPDGNIVLLTTLCEGQRATALQLPAQPTTQAAEEAKKRAAYSG
jgi:hypothetical protein